MPDDNTERVFHDEFGWDAREAELQAVVHMITRGLEVADAEGKHVFRWGNGYMVQESYRSCCEYDDPEEAARAFLSATIRWKE